MVSKCNLKSLIMKYQQIKVGLRYIKGVWVFEEKHVHMCTNIKVNKMFSFNQHLFQSWTFNATINKIKYL